jgi:hypothetical protein
MKDIWKIEYPQNQVLVDLMILIEKLDEAMASPERIAADTKAVGGFVSTLDITETAEEIILRAIERIKRSK